MNKYPLVYGKQYMNIVMEAHLEYFEEQNRCE